MLREKSSSYPYMHKCLKYFKGFLVIYGIKRFCAQSNVDLLCVMPCLSLKYLRCQMWQSGWFSEIRSQIQVSACMSIAYLLNLTSTTVQWILNSSKMGVCYWFSNLIMMTLESISIIFMHINPHFKCTTVRTSIDHIH